MAMNLRTLFEDDYCGYDVIFNEIIKKIWPNVKQANKSYPINSSDKQLLNKITAFATEESTDIVFYDIELTNNVQLYRNRQTIKRYVTSLIDSYQSGLIFFHYADKKSEWRISYVYKGVNNRDVINPKRYTYLCGKEYPSRTAAQSFSSLFGKSNIDEDELINAFSVEPLSKEFFDRYKALYIKFCDYIILKQKKVFVDDFKSNEKLVRDYVKKMFGRIVFLHFLQKKGWMGCSENSNWSDGDKNFMFHLFEKSKNEQKDFLESVLEPLFFGMLNTSEKDRKQLFETKGWDLNLLKTFGKIPYLNGGLFEEDELDKSVVKFEKSLFEELFNFFNEYNFTIDETDPDEKEIGVDPEMLGKIFENLLEDNKDKGAFYTPKEIVQYMCQESLISYLETKISDKSCVRDFVLNPKKPEDKKTESELTNALLNIKICDPAIGSGAFPMGLLNELFNCLHVLVDDSMSRVDLKKHIVKNNIYGVDIEKGAIDIARLRFWLAIIVDEDLKDGRDPEPLPNLDYKFMQGNSLIESYNGIDLKDISKKVDLPEEDLFSKESKSFNLKRQINVQIDAFQNNMQEFYSTSDHKKKLELQKEIDEFVKFRVFATMNADIESISEEITNCEYNLSNIRTSLDSVKNYKNDPSYIKQKNLFDRTKKHLDDLNLKKEQLIKKVEKTDDTALDASQYFLWHTWFNEVLDKGKFDIVIANPPYIDSERMVNMGLDWERKLLNKKFSNLSGNWDMYMAFLCLASEMGKIVTFITPDKWLSKPFGEKFRKNVMIQRLYKATKAGSKVFANATVDAFITLFVEKSETMKAYNFISEDKIKLMSETDLSNLSEPYLIDYLFSENIDLISKIDSTKAKLLKYAKCEGACAVSDVTPVRNLIVTNKNPDTKKFYKLINTGTILKYGNLWPHKSITYDKSSFDYPVVPIKNFESNLGKTYIKRAASPKIIFKGINLLDGCLDEKAEILPGKTTLVICNDDISLLKFLLGLLNSKLIFFFIKTKYSSSSYCGGITFTPDMINNLPVPNNTSCKKEIIKCVNTILDMKNKDIYADITKELDDIDTQVYKMYDIKPEEKLIIEKALKKKTKKQKN